MTCGYALYVYRQAWRERGTAHMTNGSKAGITNTYKQYIQKSATSSTSGTCIQHHLSAIIAGQVLFLELCLYIFYTVYCNSIIHCIMKYCIRLKKSYFCYSVDCFIVFTTAQSAVYFPSLYCLLFSRPNRKKANCMKQVDQKPRPTEVCDPLRRTHTHTCRISPKRRITEKTNSTNMGTARESHQPGIWTKGKYTCYTVCRQLHPFYV